ncbi:MAG: response regulator [bacterium]|nr:response regulator [bacterium]
MTRILLVENDQDGQIEQALDDTDGIELQTVTTLQEARDILKFTEYELIITEMDLPGGKGTELTGTESRRLPVLIINKEKNKELKKQVIEEGALDYVEKTEASLIALPIIIERVLGKWELITKQKEEEYNRKWMEDTLTRVNNKFLNLVLNIPGVVFQRAYDEDWTMFFMSDEIETLTGYPSSDFVKDYKRTYLDIIHPEDRAAVEALVEQGITKDRHYQAEYRVVDSGGAVHWVSDRGQSVNDSNGGILWIDGSVLDITKQKQAETEQKRLNDELTKTNTELKNQGQKLRSTAEELLLQHEKILKINNKLDANSRSKSEMLANMSHELRSPLNSLLILAQDLSKNSEGNLHQDQVESSKIIYKCGNDLLQLINDILDLSKIEAGKMRPFVSEFPVKYIADAIYYVFKHVAENKKILLNIDISKDVPETIQTDMQKLEQIIRNFMSNAIKFTREGSITMLISRPGPDTRFINNKPDHSSTVAFSVIDTGVGIPEEKQEAVFIAFEQADESTSQNFGGTGLGLSISRLLADLLGGEIQLESEEGEGSAFTLYIPEKLPEREEEKREQEPRISKIEAEIKTRATKDLQFNGEKILIVDDDMRNLFTIAKQVKDEGMAALKTGNGAKARAVLEKEPGIDLILLDMKKPLTDETDVMRYIREDDKLKRVPIIAMGTKSKTQEREAFLAQGADDYLQKPVNIDTLLLSMHRLLYGDKEV